MHGEEKAKLMKKFLSDKQIGIVFSKESLLKRKQTRIKNGLQISDELLTAFQLYKKEVDKETRKHKKNLYTNWAGRCFYSNRLIYNEPKWSKYEPTIDHVVSIFFGFTNNWSPKIVGGYDNLVICCRYINSKKGKKCYDFSLLM